MLRARVRIEDLPDKRILRRHVEAMDLKLATQGADEDVVFIDLIDAGRACLDRDLENDLLAARLDVHFHDQNLLAVEARHCQNGRR